MICRDSQNWEQSRMSNQTVNLPYLSMGIPPPFFGVRYHASLTIERDPNSGILEGPVKTLAQPCALPIQSWPVVWQRAGGSGAECCQSSLVACCWTIFGYLFVRDINMGISAQIKCFTSFRPVDPLYVGKASDDALFEGWLMSTRVRLDSSVCVLFRRFPTSLLNLFSWLTWPSIVFDGLCLRLNCLLSKIAGLWSSKSLRLLSPVGTWYSENTCASPTSLKSMQTPNRNPKSAFQMPHLRCPCLFAGLFLCLVFLIS